jgi:hypothetical protein
MYIVRIVKKILMMAVNGVVIVHSVENNGVETCGIIQTLMMTVVILYGKDRDNEGDYCRG